MKTVGIIGGIGPESTIEYYRFIIDAWRKQTQDGSYPSIIINSVDVSKLLAWMEANESEAFTDYLANEIEKLARAGADFGALAANTPHIVFDELRRRSQIPLVSIVEATCDEARSLGLKRVALFGTRFTMQGRFYPEVFSKGGITIVAPSDNEQAYIHDIYTKELLNNIFLPETRDALLAIVERLKIDEGIEGLILGGTEFPLILRDASDQGIPFLDTTMIHVGQIMTGLFSEAHDD
jgi:aspartate racemase